VGTLKNRRDRKSKERERERKREREREESLLAFERGGAIVA
jgi:hypothetical protein